MFILFLKIVVRGGDTNLSSSRTMALYMLILEGVGDIFWKSINILFDNFAAFSYNLEIRSSYHHHEWYVDVGMSRHPSPLS